jgi:hypothetical protein
MNRDVLVIVLQILGVLFIATGGWMVAPELGWGLLGVGCLAFGLALERDT